MVSCAEPLRRATLRLLPAKRTEVLHRQSNTDSESIDFRTLQFLAAGKSGVVYGIDNKRVLKEFHDCDRGEAERQAYHRLGSHPSIAQLLGIRKDGSIILERGDVLRTLCRSPSANGIPIQRKLDWLSSAAEAYQHVHDSNMVHGDVGSHNMILTREGNLKIVDFEGCSIDGEAADSCCEWFSYRPSIPRVSRQTDIFAFGCAIYEVLTGRPPYYEYEKLEDPHQQVEKLYTNDHFPDVMSLPLGRLIWSCWQKELTSMDEIVRELKAFHP